MQSLKQPAGVMANACLSDASNICFESFMLTRSFVTFFDQAFDSERDTIVEPRAARMAWQS
jgi:hypothetical protein